MRAHYTGIEQPGGRTSATMMLGIAAGLIFAAGAAYRCRVCLAAGARRALS